MALRALLLLGVTIVLSGVRAGAFEYKPDWELRVCQATAVG